MSDGDNQRPEEADNEALEIDPSQAGEELLESLQGIAIPAASERKAEEGQAAAMAELLEAAETDVESDARAATEASSEAEGEEALQSGTTDDNEAEGVAEEQQAEDAPTEPPDAEHVSEPSAEAQEPTEAASADSGDEEQGASWLPDGAPLAEDVDVEVIRARISNEIAGLEGEVDEPPPPVIDWDRTELRQAVEALLLVATKPLSLEAFEKCLPGLEANYIRGFLDGLSGRFEHEKRGWQLRRVGKGWQLLTRPELHPWVRQLDRKELPERLSRSAMETLAIVAYKQPITRGEIEDIRGVQCGPMLRQLMDMKLVQVLGRNDDAVGRPLIYGTSPIFLDRFGLGSLADLPRRHEFG